MFKKVASLIYLKNVSRSKDIELFLIGYKFDKMFSDQIKAILKIIDSELIRSFNFGLKISREHVLKEKTTFLFILNEMGNLHLIPKRWEFEEAIKIFGEFMYKALEGEVGFYFKKLSDKKGATRTMYNCHLEAATASVFRAIYNHQIPFT
jgi:hypothetical protein